jgi:hypothetical protein
MTDQAPVLRSRTTPAVATPVPIAEAELELELRKAHAIARAGDAIPKGYRGNDGAVLLALEWSQHHGMTLLQAMQCVSFVQGRPVVDATAQRALAERAGYQVIPTEITPSSATVTVSRDGVAIGIASYTLDDAKRANLLGKDNWRTNPEDMLVARATTRAVRRYAPTVLFGLATPDEIDDPLEIPAAPEPPPTLATTLERDQAPVEPEQPVGTKITPTTRGNLQAALDAIGAGEIRAQLRAVVDAHGIDPGSLTARRFRELTNEQALWVIEQATELVEIQR